MKGKRKNVGEVGQKVTMKWLREEEFMRRLMGDGEG